jgi:SSS family transporter
MKLVDWIVLCGTLLLIVLYGIYKSRKQKNIESYLLGDKSLPWYQVMFGVMATQASAVTFLSAPGQAYTDGMRFIQYYLGMPFAMIIVSAFFIPIYRKLNIYTAYQLLEKKFDKKTRVLTAVFFLMQRGLAAGLTIYAPALVLSSMLGWNLFITNLIMGGLVICYTVSGGTKAVAHTQMQQMIVIIIGIFIAGYYIILLMPEKISMSNALYIAGNMGKLNTLETQFSWSDKYNIWSGIIGGFFLSLSYFGTDQSQVGRYITGKSIRQSRIGILMNALVKIPMQFLILLIGALLFVFYQFHHSPIHFNNANMSMVESKNRAYHEKINQQYNTLQANKIEIAEDLSFAINQQQEKLKKQKLNELKKINIAENELRENYKKMIVKLDNTAEAKDTNYIFLTFVFTYLPAGLIGLLIAVIFCASWSSTAAELNALASTTVIDLYHHKTQNMQKQLLLSRITTIAWGIVAIAFAEFASNAGNSLIEAVNVLGSLFYGTVLGVFILALFFKNVRGTQVFISALISEAIVIYIHIFHAKDISFLWYNLIGCLNTLLLANIMSIISRLQK